MGDTDMKAFLVVFSIVLNLTALVQMTAKAAEPLSLEGALSEALAVNPGLAATAARSSVEHSAIRSQYSLDNPKIGFMRENNLNFMEQQMGPMNSWSISQEIKFPVKYFLMGSAQISRAEASDQMLQEKRLEIRGKVISAYYNVYVSDRIIALFEAQKETLREIARIAESRYATGAVAQQDQMKAHVEQAKVENELIMVRQERESMVAMLNALLNRDAYDEITLPSQDLPIPSLENVADSMLKNVMATSKRIKASKLSVRESDTNKALAGWSYAPDLMVSYRKPYSGAPEGAYAFAVELSIPLWFFMKQTSEYSAASLHVVEAEKTHEATVRDTTAEARSLFAKVRSNGSLIKVYETSLIPLANNTLNSSRAAYRAGKTSFIELLDSERALYETRIAYYRTQVQYVEVLVKLEQVAGVRLSSLPGGKNI